MPRWTRRNRNGRHDPSREQVLALARARGGAGHRHPKPRIGPRCAVRERGALTRNGLTRTEALSARVKELETAGITVLDGVYGRGVVAGARRSVLENVSLFKNTRATASARHLAGFHRFSELERLHALLSSDPSITEALTAAVGGNRVRAIGLSDITINRSQGWHKDLLRGKYSGYLSDSNVCWGPEGGGVYKVLLYLQSGSSLKVVRGSHRVPVSLERDSFCVPAGGEVTDLVPVSAGDVVIMDVRLTHRGASEAQCAAYDPSEESRILISSVYGRAAGGLTKAMEIGNLHRLMDWDCRPSHQART